MSRLPALERQAEGGRDRGGIGQVGEGHDGDAIGVGVPAGRGEGQGLCLPLVRR